MQAVRSQPPIHAINQTCITVECTHLRTHPTIHTNNHTCSETGTCAYMDASVYVYRHARMQPCALAHTYSFYQIWQSNLQLSCMHQPMRVWAHRCDHAQSNTQVCRLVCIHPGLQSALHTCMPPCGRPLIYTCAHTGMPLYRVVRTHTRVHSPASPCTETRMLSYASMRSHIHPYAYMCSQLLTHTHAATTPHAHSCTSRLTGECNLANTQVS